MNENQYKQREIWRCILNYFCNHNKKLRDYDKNLRNEVKKNPRKR